MAVSSVLLAIAWSRTSSFGQGKSGEWGSCCGAALLAVCGRHSPSLHRDGRRAGWHQATASALWAASRTRH